MRAIYLICLLGIHTISAAAVIKEPKSVDINSVDLNNLDPEYWTAYTHRDIKNQKTPDENVQKSNHHTQDIKDSPNNKMSKYDDGDEHKDYKEQQDESDSKPHQHVNTFAKRDMTAESKSSANLNQNERGPYEDYIISDKVNPIKEDWTSTPLKDIPLISPREGLPKNYFNLSEFRSWKAIDDVRPNPKDKPKDWRVPHDQAICILGGIGQREVGWMPNYIKEFFEEPAIDRWETPDFRNFWNKDPARQLWKSYTAIVYTTHVFHSWGGRGDQLDANHHTHEKNNKCRDICRSCYDAAVATGAEQFMCDYGYKHNDHGAHSDPDKCRMGLLKGDLVGTDHVCEHYQVNNVYKVQAMRRRLRPRFAIFPPDAGLSIGRRCGEKRKAPTNYAQEGAPRNAWPNTKCLTIIPCDDEYCARGNDTVEFAVGLNCYGSVGLNQKYFAMQWAMPYDSWEYIPRFGAFEHPSLASAMADQTLRVYYTDISPEPSHFEKAILLGSQFAWQKAHEWINPLGPQREWVAAQMGVWAHWDFGDDIPARWVEQHYFNRHYTKWLYTGGVAFGTREGGTYLDGRDAPPEHWN